MDKKNVKKTLNYLIKALRKAQLKALFFNFLFWCMLLSHGTRMVLIWFKNFAIILSKFLAALLLMHPYIDSIN